MDEDDRDMMSDTGCRICLVEHDPEIHDATLRVHNWFRDEVNRLLRPIAVPESREETKPKRQTPSRAA